MEIKKNTSLHHHGHRKSVRVNKPYNGLTQGDEYIVAHENNMNYCLEIGDGQFRYIDKKHCEVL